MTRTIREINQIYNECKEMCEAIGMPFKRVPLTFNNRLTSALGRCRSKYDSKVGDYVAYEIELSTAMRDDSVPVENIKNTLIHEICHTVKPSDHHRGLWKIWANKVKTAYGINIQRLASEEESEVFRASVVKNATKVYVLTCEKCNYEVKYTRMSKFVKNPSHYTHRGCGGKFHRD